VLTAQPADRDFLQNFPSLSQRRGLHDKGTAKKGPKAALLPRGRVGLARERDWVVDAQGLEPWTGQARIALGLLKNTTDPFLGVTTADARRCRNAVQGGAYRLSSQSRDWVGFFIADQLKINVAHGGRNDPKDLARIKQILGAWLQNGVLATEKRRDESRKERDFVIPGPTALGEPASVSSHPDDTELTLS
jgi:hypothetical protein